MPFENNGTSQKWHMTNTPPKTEKCDTHKNFSPTKMAHLAKKMHKGEMPRAELSHFLKGILKFVV